MSKEDCDPRHAALSRRQRCGGTEAGGCFVREPGGGTRSQKHHAGRGPPVSKRRNQDLEGFARQLAGRKCPRPFTTSRRVETCDGAWIVIFKDGDHQKTGFHALWCCRDDFDGGAQEANHPNIIAELPGRVRLHGIAAPGRHK
jgi:hypothetical protein